MSESGARSAPEELAPDPTPSALQTSLRALRPSPEWGNARVTGLHELTPGLSGSRVFRVSLSGTKPIVGPSRPEKEQPPFATRGVTHHRPTIPPSLILKIPDWGAPSGIASRDPWVMTRELHFYESGLAASLPLGMRAPRLLGIDRTPPGRGTWLWTDDESGPLAIRWRPADAITAAARVARLHSLFRSGGQSLEREQWLERQGYAAYRHHVPAAHRHLETLSATPRWSSLLSQEEREALHRALDLTPQAMEAMDRLPPTLVHGDFHIGNLGLDRSGNDATLVVIDWAHVGLAPLGCDVATLVSLYSVMGGAGESGDDLEHAVQASYIDALRAQGTGSYPEADLRALVSRACALWHLTWGLFLRLGPGLDWLLRRPDQDSDEAQRSALDIRRGCLRALAAVAHL